MSSILKQNGEPGSSFPDTPVLLRRRPQNPIDTSTMLRRHEDKVYRLWDELSDFGSCETNDALFHCMRSICALIGAQNAYWMGAVNMKRTDDLLSGWRIGTMEVLNPEHTCPKRIQSGIQVLHTNEPGDTTLAVVSGAGRFRVFWHITLPLLRPIMAFVLTFAIIGSYNLFTEPITLLDATGGPRNSGLTMTMYLYTRGFRELKMGYASAIGYTLAIIIIALTVLQLILTRAFREA